MNKRLQDQVLRPWRQTTPGLRLAALALVIAAGPGCLRTTSLGRAAATDAPVEQHDGAADRQDDRRTDDGAVERGSQVDARPDASIDMGPIVGGGRDANSDGDDSAGATPDAAMD